MKNPDETYLFFTRCYINKEFGLAGKIMFEILDPLFQNNPPLDVSWKYKLSELLQFLHQSHYLFDNSDSFYDMLATIAIRIKADQSVHWKVILN